MEGELHFINEEMGASLTAIFDGERVAFFAKDLCDALGISNSRDAVRSLDDDERGVVITDADGARRERSVVYEPGLYSLILRSRKQGAKKFKRWVIHDVLPSIRKHGAYMTPSVVEEALLNPDTIINLAQQIKSEREKRITLEKRIKKDKPKIDFYRAVTGSNDAISIGEVAKVLRFKLHGKRKVLGPNQLFAFLREKKVLRENNQPYQEFVDRKYFRCIEQKYTRGGETCINIKTVVYQRGVDYIRKILEKANDQGQVVTFDEEV